MKAMMQGINELKQGQQKYEEEMRVLRSKNADLKAKLNELGSRTKDRMLWRQQYHYRTSAP